MPSVNGKPEGKAAAAEAPESPVRQIVTLLEHKIRNLEKRKSKLTSYRDLQKSGKDLNSDQRIAVAKYDEVAVTLDFARDLCKQVNLVAITADREAKKQAKKDAWIRATAETNKIREVLLIVDCLMQMGNADARNDFLNGSNGAAKLKEEDLEILDNLYPEVTPKHEVNEEGAPGFLGHASRAAEHLYCIIDGKPKDVLGTTYAHIKEIVSAVHECGYFDKSFEPEPEPEPVPAPPEELEHQQPPEMAAYPPPALPVPPAAAVVPAPAYPMHPLPPITLQEIENSYFAQQYPPQRPISEVIGSQNFYFLQESEIDSPAGTPQPPLMTQQSPPAPIPTQTFTNQHFVQLPPGRVPPDPSALPIPQPHFAPPDHPAFVGLPLPPQHHAPQPHPAQPAPPAPARSPEEHSTVQPDDQTARDDDWKESSPERLDGDDRKGQGQGDGQHRFRRYGRGPPRGSSNGYRGRGGYQPRHNNDSYSGRHDYQSRPSGRQYGDGYGRNNGYNNNRSGDGGYSNGDADGGAREYTGGYKGRGRGAPRGGSRGSGPRGPRQHYGKAPAE